MDQLHLFISLLLRGLIISKCSLKMSGKVREFDHDWRVATLGDQPLLNAVLFYDFFVSILLVPVGIISWQ